MRRILLLLAVSLTTAMAWAVKADPTPIVVTQPDGTRLTVVLHGDEHINWYSTLDGVLLVQTNAGYFVADIDDNGELTATRQLAHDRNERQATELTLVEQQPRDRFFAASQQSRFAAEASEAKLCAQGSTHQGSGHTLSAHRHPEGTDTAC